MNEQALKQKLHKASQELGMTFNACLRRLVLERFLVRLSKSEWRDKFVFKGGMLLANYISLNRVTTDLDFLAVKMNVQKSKIKSAMEQLANENSDDGFIFTFLELNELQHEMTEYSGFEAVFQASFNQIRERVHIDIGVGDIVEPVEEKVQLIGANKSSIFEDFVSLMVYPYEYIFSEKLHTAVARGARNSRMKDYHDIFLMMQIEGFNANKNVIKAVESTFKNRNTNIVKNMLDFSDLEMNILQKMWSSYQKGLRVSGMDISTPGDILIVINQIKDWLNNSEISGSQP